MIKNFSYDRFHECTSENLRDLKKILEYNINKGIYLFRISSDIIPFGSHEINNIKWQEIFKDELKDIGDYVKEKGIRVSMHPGQYTVLNSPNEQVVKRAIEDIEYHNSFLESLGLDYTHKIVIHMGGIYDQKDLAMERFQKSFKKLSSSAKKRLILENDDKSYNIEEVLRVCESIHIPAVFDNLHHKLNPYEGWDYHEIFKRVKETWTEEDGNMKIHYSDRDEAKGGGAHSKFVVSENFLNYYEIIKEYDADIMLEVKDKDISAIKCVNLLFNEDKKGVLYEQWAKYKYLVMEKDYALYKQCSAMMNEGVSLKDFYLFIDKCLAMPYNQGNFKNTALHVWGYFKDCASEKERRDFLKFIDECSAPDKIKNKLLKLAIKYDSKYLKESYYFLV